jgi:hypothetical protein
MALYWCICLCGAKQEGRFTWTVDRMIRDGDGSICASILGKCNVGRSAVSTGPSETTGRLPVA